MQLCELEAHEEAVGDNVLGALQCCYDQTHEYLHHTKAVETMGPREMESELEESDSETEWDY